MGACCGVHAQKEPLIPEVPAEFKNEMQQDIDRCVRRSSMVEDEDDGALAALVRKPVISLGAGAAAYPPPSEHTGLRTHLTALEPHTRRPTVQVDSIKETDGDKGGRAETGGQENSKREVADITKARLQVHHEKLVIEGKARARSQSVVIKSARRASISIMEQNHIAKGGTKQEFESQMGQMKRQRTQSLPNLADINPSRRFSISGRRNSTSQEGAPPAEQQRKNSIVKFSTGSKVAPAPLNDAAAAAALVPELDPPSERPYEP